MASKPLPSPEVLRQLLQYEPETGKLFWKYRGPEWFTLDRLQNTWNSNYAGREALSRIDPLGYRRGKILIKSYMAHRVIWCMCNGDTDMEIDHINGVRSDNRIKNLRAATRSENMKNRASHGGSCFLGVDWHKRNRRWRARINDNGRKIEIGEFQSETDAARAYDRAAIVAHGRFARLNFPEMSNG